MIGKDGSAFKIKTPECAASSAALTVAAGAVACGVCCVLPFALPAVALAGAGGVIAWFGRLQSWATALAALIVTSAWVWITVQSFRTKGRPASSTFYAMGAATAALLVAMSWSRIEPYLVHALSAGVRH